MTPEQAMVAAFHRRFGSPPPEQPDLEHFPGALRVRLIQEEADEFAQAVAEGDLVEMVDALCDLLYVTYGAAVDLGVDLEPFFAEVHRSNMAKVGGTQARGRQVAQAGGVDATGHRRAAAPASTGWTSSLRPLRRRRAPADSSLTSSTRARRAAV